MREYGDATRVIDETADQIEHGSRFPGMSYEEGVRAALEWFIEDTDTEPMDE
jgi:hypothetical protein